MKTRTLKSDAILLLASAIWGFAFVAQRAGMEFVGPFLFNGVRFALGTLVLLPFLFHRKRSQSGKRHPGRQSLPLEFRLFSGMLAGFLIFAGASLQQVGIVYTTAGKAGFITGLYVLLVPILGLLWGKASRRLTWAGAVLAALGMYFLSVTRDFTIARGDLLVLAGAFFWALHVQLIDGLVNRLEALELAVYQFSTCAFLSLAVALFTEPIHRDALQAAYLPILYAGVLSVGVAYTLQLVGQKEAHPSHAAIILSLEAVFAVIGGWLILHERLSSREILGCLLMLSGMLLSQAGSPPARPETETKSAG